MKKLKRVLKNEKEGTYMCFFFISVGGMGIRLLFFSAHTFWRPDLVELFALP